MAKFTFKGGIHPYDGKDLSKDKPIVDAVPGEEMVYPLSQHIGAPAKPLVKKTPAQKKPPGAPKFFFPFFWGVAVWGGKGVIPFGC